MEKRTFATIDEYIAHCPAAVGEKLRALRALIAETAPGAKEKISYGIPTFYLNGNLVHFAAFNRHIGFYPTSSAIAAFARELEPYVHAKGSIQFPLAEPLPLDLIRRMVAFRVAESEATRRRARRSR